MRQKMSRDSHHPFNNAGILIYVEIQTEICQVAKSCEIEIQW